MSIRSALAGHLRAMWEIILLGLILMVIGVLLPTLIPVGMVLIAKSLTVHASKALSVNGLPITAAIAARSE